MDLPLYVSQQQPESDSRAESSSNQQKPGSRHQVKYLLAGLERQKDELGPIADELIVMLKQLGTTESA